MNKEKRCLKSTIYIYMPDQKDANNKTTTRDYLTQLGGGRIQFYDQNNQKEGKMIAYPHIGAMLNLILTRYQKRTMQRIKTK